MAEKQFLTKKGYDERVARLEELKVVRRKEVAQKLKEFLLTVRLFRITIRIKM